MGLTGEESAEYIMWYHGRSETKDENCNLPPLSTGRVGMAYSRNGLHWERPKVGSLSEDKEGVALGLNKDSWWGFDTSHVGLGQVLLPMSTPAIMSEGGVYIMYYMGGTYEETPICNYMDVNSDAKVQGMRMKIGVALSQDGKSWGRVEGDDHTGACLVPYDREAENCGGIVFDDSGNIINVDEELYVAWPDVMLNTYTQAGDQISEFLMFYSTCLKYSKQKAIGLAVSRDGFRWERRGIVLRPGENEDVNGCARCTVLKEAMFNENTNTWVNVESNELVMWYEGIDKDGKHRILSATSGNGGRTWNKQSGHVALDVGQSGDWDDKAVGSPNVLRMEDGTLRMYYSGQDSKGNTAIGVAKASMMQDTTHKHRFEREQAQVLFGQ